MTPDQKAQIPPRAGFDEEKLDQLADEFVNENVPAIYESLEKAQIPYSDEMICLLMADSFKAGMRKAPPTRLPNGDGLEGLLNEAHSHMALCRLAEIVKMIDACTGQNLNDVLPIRFGQWLARLQSSVIWPKVCALSVDPETPTPATGEKK